MPEKICTGSDPSPLPALVFKTCLGNGLSLQALEERTILCSAQSVCSSLVLLEKNQMRVMNHRGTLLFLYRLSSVSREVAFYNLFSTLLVSNLQSSQFQVDDTTYIL